MRTSLLLILLLLPAVVQSQPASLARQIEDTFEELDRSEAVRITGSLEAAEQRNAMKWILREDRFAAKPGVNHALFLLVHLHRKRPVRAGDTMPLALALAYNYHYSVGNEEVRKALRSEIISHYDFYRVVLEWQKKYAPFAALDKLPVIAQTYWASRDRSVYEIRTPDVLELRLPPVRHWMRLHVLLSEEKAVGGRSTFELAHSIQYYYRSKKLPAARLTKELRTYAAGPLLAFQEKSGLFAAENCVSDATNLGVLFQAMGLAPLFYYQNFRSAGASEGINHEWPAVYDVQSQSFITAQKGNPWPAYTAKETPVDFEIFRPMWHHAWMEQGWEEDNTMQAEERAPAPHIGGRLRRNSYAERTTNGAMRDFVFRGLTSAQMEELWNIAVWRKSADGRFTARAAPPK
jgi:hypothetical protein